MAQNKILSTGVLVRDPASFNAHVDVVNVDPALSQTVAVEILDWGVDQVWSKPTPVPVNPSGPVTVGPHTHQSFIALITQSTAQPSLALSLYEIRVTIPDDPQLVVNCFARDASGRIIEGNTVLHADLAEVAGPMDHAVSHLTGMIDAVTDAGADPTFATDSTSALSNAVAMCFGYPTMVALDAALPPATNVRQPTKWLYIPPGTYKLLESLTLRSMSGLVIRGGGRFTTTVLSVKGGTSSSPLIAALDLNGVALSTFKDFAVSVDGTGDVRALIYLHWDPNRARRSTMQNTFYSVLAAARVVDQNGSGSFRDAAWQIGTLPGDGPQLYQCDQTQLFNCMAWGDYDSVRGDRTLVGGVMKKDLYFQRGFRFGDGRYGNNGWHHAYGLTAHHCKYGVDWWAAECPIFGGLIQSNDVDLYASSPPASYITVKNIRSEDSGRFFATSGGGGNTNPFHASLEDCHWTVSRTGFAFAGTVASATSNTLASDQSLTPGAWIGYVVRIVTGKGLGQSQRIISNTDSILTLAGNWTSPLPEMGSWYVITQAATGGSTTSLVKSGAGWTANQFRGWYVYLLTGPGQGQVGWIDSNTSDTLTIDNTHADVPLSAWTAAPDINTAFAPGKNPPDGEFIQWNFAGVFRLTGMQAYDPVFTHLGIRHRIGLHASVRQCTALIDGGSFGETTRAEAFSGASPLAAIDVRGWESVDISGQIEHDSEAGRVLVNAGEAVDVKTIAASITLDKVHEHIRVDATAGAVIVTLPDATRFAGRRFTLKKIDASTHVVTIQGQSGCRHPD
jgi:hypothetical protein